MCKFIQRLRGHLGNNKGIALVSVLVVSTVLALVGSSYLSTSTHEAGLINQQVSDSQLLYAAEAGMASGKRAVSEALTPCATTSLEDGQVYIYSNQLTLSDQSAVQLETQISPSGGVYTITSTATLSNGKYKTISGSLTEGAGESISLFDYGIYAGEDVTIGTGSKLYKYDSQSDPAVDPVEDNTILKQQARKLPIIEGDGFNSAAFIAQPTLPDDSSYTVVPDPCPAVGTAFSYHAVPQPENPPFVGEDADYGTLDNPTDFDCRTHKLIAQSVRANGRTIYVQGGNYEINSSALDIGWKNPVVFVGDTNLKITGCLECDHNIREASLNVRDQSTLTFKGNVTMELTYPLRMRDTFPGPSPGSPADGIIVEGNLTIVSHVDNKRAHNPPALIAIDRSAAISATHNRKIYVTRDLTIYAPDGDLMIKSARKMRGKIRNSSSLIVDGNATFNLNNLVVRRKKGSTTGNPGWVSNNPALTHRVDYCKGHHFDAVPIHNRTCGDQHNCHMGYSWMRGDIPQLEIKGDTILAVSGGLYLYYGDLKFGDSTSDTTIIASKGDLHSRNTSITFSGDASVDVGDGDGTDVLIIFGKPKEQPGHQDAVQMTQISFGGKAVFEHNGSYMDISRTELVMNNDADDKVVFLTNNVIHFGKYGAPLLVSTHDTKTKKLVLINSGCKDVPGMDHDDYPVAETILTRYPMPGDVDDSEAVNYWGHIYSPQADITLGYQSDSSNTTIFQGAVVTDRSVRLEKDSEFHYDEYLQSAHQNNYPQSVSEDSKIFSGLYGMGLQVGNWTAQ